MAQSNRTTPGRGLVGMRLPSCDPATFSPGDIISLDGTDYVVLEIQRGQNRVMVFNPRFTPGGGEPRFLNLHLADSPPLALAA
jgi:hypothetical protein